jgi:pimeloyl-ACP methyl ester carboxylesterase
MHRFLRTTVFVLLAAMAIGGSALAQPPATESGFVQVEDDVRLFYQRFGTGTPKVFIPNWHELVTRFAPLLHFHDVVLWDPRGRGLSDRPDDLSRYGLEVEFSDTEALRRHFGAEKVTYVGISIWANLGMLYAARHPESVERVVALGPFEVAQELGAPPDRVVDHGIAALAAEVEAMEADGRNVTEAYRYCRLEKRVFFSESYFDLRNMAAFEAANVCQYPNEGPGLFYPMLFDGIFPSLGEWDWREEMTRVVAPVLILFGDHEWSIAGVEAHADYLQDVGWLMVPNAGHHVWNDRPDVVLPMMDTFFRGGWPEGLNR